MHVIASFEYSTELELALSKLEKIGVTKENILAIPLDEVAENQQMLDTIHDADGNSVLDLGFVLAAIFMLLGSIYGFVLKWGPIIWGLIGLVFGLLLGVLIKVLFIKGKKLKWAKGKTTEVFVVVNCSEAQKNEIKNIFLKHTAFGVGFLEK